jgi:hypothetical protein
VGNKNWWQRETARHTEILLPHPEIFTVLSRFAVRVLGADQDLIKYEVKESISLSLVWIELLIGWTFGCAGKVMFGRCCRCRSGGAIPNNAQLNSLSFEF